MGEGRTEGRTDARGRTAADDLGLGRVGHLTHDDFSQCLSLPAFLPQSSNNEHFLVTHKHTHSQPRRDAEDGRRQTDKNVTRQRKRETDLGGGGNDADSVRPRLFRVTKRGKPAERRKCRVARISPRHPHTLDRRDA